MRKYSLLVFLILLGCSSHENSAGKGVITETTNVGVARGHVELFQGDSVPRAIVRIFRAEDIPAAWEGAVYAVDTTDAEGNWSVEHLYVADYQAVAVSMDSAYMGQVYFTIDENQDSLAALAIPLAAPDTLSGVFADYQAVQDTLSEGYRLRACLRGLGYSVFLTETGTYEFTGVPRGRHFLRIQSTDWVPGHEITIWEDWVEVK